MFLWLQTTMGNRAVQRLLAKKKSEAGSPASCAGGPLSKGSAKDVHKSKWRYYWVLIIHVLSLMAVWKRPRVELKQKNESESH